MTRMERPTATMAFFVPRRRAIRRHPVYLDTVDAIWRGLKRYLD